MRKLPQNICNSLYGYHLSTSNKEGSVAEWYKVLIHNQEVPSASPLPASQLVYNAF